MNLPMEKPVVTIGIPTYNRADRNLGRALEAALGQTYEDIEVVVSDNCSSDNTEALVRGHADHRIRYIRQSQNIGANGNFNACLAAARGTYFLLLHDDDLIDADFVENCLVAGGFSDAYGFIRTGTRTIDSEGRMLREFPNRTVGDSQADLFLAWLEGRSALFLCTTLFNTTALRQIGGFRSKHNLFEDGVAIVKISGFRPWRDVEAVKGSFRIHPGQRTFSAQVAQWCEEFDELLQMMAMQVPLQREEILEKGSRFFARLAVNRARANDVRWRRWLALLTVARHFPYRNWPVPKRKWLTHIAGRP